MNIRKLVPTSDSRIRFFEVFDDAGKLIGTDEEPIPTPEEANAVTLRSRLLQSLAANVAYTALTAPTATQTTAQTRRNAQQNIALIRLMLELLDTTDGT
jgi:hypothetical protein